MKISKMNLKKQNGYLAMKLQKQERIVFGIYFMPCINEKKLFVTLLLFFVSTSTFAEWVSIPGGDYYIDKSSINRVGDFARFWRYMNFKEESRIKSYKSVVAREEFDCINQTLRIISFTEYSEYDLKGTGRKIATDQLPEKEFVEPNTNHYR